MAQPIFISYSRVDYLYVEQFAAFLSAAGLPYWYDHRVPPGERFDKVIAHQIDSCAALVVVMTPASFDSDWVANEINYASLRRRPILPLLLEGDVFISLTSRDYEVVLGGKMPSPRFMDRLKSLAGNSGELPPSPMQAWVDASPGLTRQ